MEERVLVESLTLSCIYKDLTLVNEINDKYFSDSTTYFFYILAKEMSKTLKEIDELSVLSWCNVNGVKEEFDLHGGYDRIENLLSMDSKVNNFNGYVDDLRKHILIDGYENIGIRMDKEYLIDEARVCPLDLLPYVDSQKLSRMLQSIILDIGEEVLNTEDKFESLHFTEEEIYMKEHGLLDDTTPFDVTLTFKDVYDGSDRYIQSFKMLNNEVNGIDRKNGVIFMGASSGTGKSSVTLQILLGLIEAGEKVLLISNEQTSLYFKHLLSAFICNHVFKCYSISRKKISKWTLTDEEKEVWFKANEFIKEKYEGSLTFWGVNEFNIDKIENKMLKLKMTEGYRYLCLDTFKPTNLSGTNVTNEYVELSRELDKFGRKNDIGIICPIQLLSSTDKISYLTASQITNGKQIKEIASKILLFRKCKNAVELDPENQQYFLKPFVWEKDQVSGKYFKRYLNIIDSSKPSDKKMEYDKHCVDINKRHLVLIIDKNRSGEDSLVYLYQFDGNTGRVTEKGLCDYISMGVLAQ